MKRWLLEPVGMTRLTLLAIAAVLGTLGAAGVVGSQVALRHLAHERERAVAAETLTRRDVEKIASRILRIESPTQAELLERIQGALRACAHDPNCLKAFRAAATDASLGDRRTTRSPQLELGTTRRPPPAPGDGSRRQRPRRQATRRPDRRHASPPRSPNDTSPGPNPSPAPGLDVHTPPELPAPALCTPLVRVNC